MVQPHEVVRLTVSAYTKNPSGKMKLLLVIASIALLFQISSADPKSSEDASSHVVKLKEHGNVDVTLNNDVEPEEVEPEPPSKRLVQSRARKPQQVGSKAGTKATNLLPVVKKRCSTPPGDLCTAKAAVLYHYVPKRNACLRMKTGGCYANDNRWASLANCESVCIEKRPPPPPPKPDLVATKKRCHTRPTNACLQKAQVRYRYDPKSNTCRRMKTGGCIANDNRWALLRNCRICIKHNRPGDNDDDDADDDDKDDDDTYINITINQGDVSTDVESNAVSNTSTGVSGSDSDENNFDYDPEPTDGEDGEISGVCHGPPVTGLCRQNAIRYYYNKRTGSCRPFVYGGCRSNGNNWRRLSDCERSCCDKKHWTLPEPDQDVQPILVIVPVDDPSVPNVMPTLPEPRSRKCYGPPDSGTCYGNKPRYFYDEVLNQCRFFLYGGCGGNDNRWVLRQCCENRCVRPKPCEKECDRGHHNLLIMSSSD